MLEIQKISNKQYSFTGTSKEEKTVQDCLKIYIDGCIFSEKYKKGHWDGYVRFYDKENRFEIGLLGEVLTQLHKTGIEYTLIEQDYREKVVSDYLFDSRLRPHQKEGVEAFFKKNYGLMVIPTRGGKTFVSF